MNTKPTFKLHCDRGWRKVVIEETHSNWQGQEYKSYLQVAIDFDVSNHKMKGYTYCIMTSRNDTLARWTSKPDEYVCQDSIEAARLWLRRMVSMERLMVLNVGYHRPQFKAMQDEATYICMPKQFKSDMYWHDALLVARHNPTTFLWYVREAGTWLILPINYGGTLHNHIKGESYSEQVCYEWNNGTLYKLEAVQ